MAENSGQWQPGQSGNPGGRRKDKPWRDALNQAVNAIAEGDPQGRKKILLIAEAVANAAMGGDMQAAREIGDRLDGKAVQAIANDDDGEPFIIKVVKAGDA